MFNNCSSITSLNLSNFNTNNVKDMSEMFSGLNKNCKTITNDETILKEIQNI
jgi:surface protein